MPGEVTFALLGVLFLLTALRTFLTSVNQLLFGAVPDNTAAVIALAVFLSSALAPVLARVYGPARAVALTALALGAATLLSTASRVAWLDLLLSLVAAVAGMWWLALLHASRPGGRPSPLPVALPLALVADFAVRQALRTVPLVDLSPAVAVPLVLASLLVFLAGGLGTIAEERTWSSPGPAGALALAALPPLLLLGETGATNAAQVALAGGLGLGPEPARATQIGAVAVGSGLAAGAILLRRDVPRCRVASATLLVGAAVMWLHVPLLSLAAGAAFACGLLMASSALVSPSGVPPPAPARAAGDGAALGTALPLAAGWVLFAVIGFAYHALYVTAAVWIAAAAVTGAVLAGPANAAARVGRGTVMVMTALAVLTPVVALGSLRSPAPGAEQVSFRVMTYNVHQGFDLGDVPSLDALTDTIAGEAPDVVVLQEVVRGWIIDGQHDVLSVLAERLGMAYVWQGNIGDLYGNAILSRMPISDVRRVAYSKGPDPRHQQRGALLARIAGVLVIATHLDHGADAGDVRERQLGELLRAWGGASPAIVAGDLNAVPASPELDLLARAGLRDLALQSGADEGTFPSDRPERRIDYIWGIGLTGAQAHTVPSTASDHRPVVVNVTRDAARAPSHLGSRPNSGGTR